MPFKTHMLPANNIPVPRQGPTVRRSLENPTTSLASPAAYALESFGAIPSTAGQSISAETALRVSALYACLRILSESIASLPCKVYERTGDGKREASDHPVYPLLHDAPNEDCTAFHFFENQMCHLPLRGNAVTQIVRDAAGRVVGLYPLHPSCVKVVRTPTGTKLYEVRVEGGGTAYLPDADVVHVPMMPYDHSGCWGLGLVGIARNSLGLSVAAEDAGSRFLGQAMRPSGALETTANLTPDQVSQLRDSHVQASTANFGKPLILPFGVQWKQISVTPDEAQYIETRKFQVVEICRWFRVPPHLVQDLERATFSNIEHQSLNFVVHTLRPWLIRWEQEFNRKLFTGSDKGRFFVEFNVDALLRGDTVSRYQAYGQGIKDGWLTRNEARLKENLNPLDGLDEPLTPLNMATGPDSNGPPPKKPGVAEAEPDEAGDTEE